MQRWELRFIFKSAGLSSKKLSAYPSLRKIGTKSESLIIEAKVPAPSFVNYVHGLKCHQQR